MGGGESKEVRVEMQSESSIVPAIECEDSNVKERKGNALLKSMLPGNKSNGGGLFRRFQGDALHTSAPVCTSTCVERKPGTRNGLFCISRFGPRQRRVYGLMIVQPPFSKRCLHSLSI